MSNLPIIPADNSEIVGTAPPSYKQQIATLKRERNRLQGRLATLITQSELKGKCCGRKAYRMRLEIKKYNEVVEMLEGMML